MWFWIRHLSAAVLLIILGVYIVVSDNPFTRSEADIGESQSEQSKASSGTKTAEGFANFYSALKAKIDAGLDPAREKYVIELKRANTTLTDELMRIGPAVKPIAANWVGPFRNRRFVEGDTLRSRMIDIAEEEHMSLIWWLERDFVVKLPFRVEETAVGTLYKMSTAIDSDFERDVHSYFCPTQRALVITDTVEHYVVENCMPARSSNTQRWRLF